MKLTTSRVMTTLAVGALAAGGALAATGAGAADHLDAPRVQKDGRTDINDLYVFQSPTDPDLTALVMTVNPGAGVLNGTSFDPNGSYNFEIDDDGDARSDHRVIVRFAAGNRNQRYTVYVDGEWIARGKVGRTTSIAGGGSATAGVFDDPFFFDLEGFQNGFAFTGDDFFAGLNVSAIVLELPLADITGESNVGVWATTEKGNGKQADRIGRPAINTVLIPSSKKNQFNRSAPHRDPGLYGDDVRAAITGLTGDPAYAAAVTDVLLPDVLTVDLSESAGFLNGRGLSDDVIDAELGILSNGGVTTDGVDANDVPFAGTFPYLAPAN